MSLPKYLEYKECGIPWIGEVPSHWIKRALQDTARSGRNAFVDGPFGSDLKSEEYADEGIPLIQLNNVSIGKHDLTNLKFIPEKKAEELARHKAMPGDIVIAKMAAPVARAAIVSSEFEQFVIVADCVKLSVDASRWNANFLQYWINSAGVNAVAETLSSGITRLRINLGSLKKLPVFQTPLSEQTAIATFLDHETGKIDSLIAEQEKLTTLLAEKRQATISHAVTKGLNPDAPMKDSGVAWLGEVPEHWEVVGLTKYLDSVVDYRGRTPTKVDEGAFLVTAKNIRNGVIDYAASQEYIATVEYDEVMRRGLPKVGDVLFTTEAPLGQVATVDREDIALAQRIIKFRANPTRLLNTYLKVWVMGSACQFNLEQLATGSTALGIKGSKIGQVRLCLPPLVEQEAIVSCIESEIGRLDQLREAADQAINLLQERRSALITAAVTGQIDVRGLVPQPEAA